MSIHWGGRGAGHVSRWSASTTGVPALVLDFLTTTSLDSRVTFTRATTATFVGSDGLIQTAAINAPRFDYNPATLAPKGLLIEEARTNILTYSEQFDNPIWIKTGSTVTANSATSPDGTATADQLANTSFSTGMYRFITATNGATYTTTVYAKYVSGSVSIRVGAEGSPTTGSTTFNISAGTIVSNGVSVVSSSITPAGNGWYRCSVTFVATSTSVGLVYYSANSSGTFLIWGAQFEAGAFSTSYIPTVASTVIRNADVALMTSTNFSSWYNQTSGTFVASANCPALGSRTVFSADDATTANLLRVRSAVADPIFVVNTGGANQASLDGGTITANTPYNQAAAYAASDFATSVNGGAAVAAATGTVPTVSRLSIGADPSGNYLNGHVRFINYYNTRLLNTQLQTLTQ
jgi:hypothetical protein